MTPNATVATRPLTRLDGSPLRVLVVDDEPNIADLLTMALRYEGWEISVAGTGTQAIALAREVVARIRLQLRRTAVPDEITLTATEFELLRYFMGNPRRVLSKAQILDRVWSYNFGGDANVVELYVSYLRKKIDAGREPMIHTLRRAGYVLKPAG
ncbi:MULTISPECIES: response regulator transcription factor [unclassified Kribbella]|uniref:response regulator transcription factor n=1 Tax=unclassified Kribbella TaxID=2644121 RepID=UPI003016099F